MSKKYILQLNVERGWRFGTTWPGYWAGIGYTPDPMKAISFTSKREAGQAMLGKYVGLNGGLDIVDRAAAKPV